MVLHSILKGTIKARDKNNLVYFQQALTKNFPFIYILVALKQVFESVQCVFSVCTV